MEKLWWLLRHRHISFPRKGNNTFPATGYAKCERGYRREFRKKTMIKYYVRGDAMGEMMTKKGLWQYRRLLLQGVDDTAQQLTELTLDKDDKTPVKMGDPINVAVERIMAVFQGNVRISGKIVVK